ncbi:MAG: DUF805 domain-containing protein [Akkermansia sp.]|nr:DUF805 domain-containing protein [Akkermansia sp.]
MSYYYLNERKEVQGPFTAGQMRRMMADGSINGQTLASAAGGGEWQPLDSLTLADDVPAVELGPCPHCHEALEGAEEPAVCPHCGRNLHPGTDNLWQNAVYAFKQMFDFRGRATRREFWSFILYSYLAQYGLAFVAILLGKTVVKVGHFDTAWFALMALVVLPGLVLIPPKLAVTVRRLHDRGHSGWWLLLVLVMSFAALRVCDILKVEPGQWYHDAIIAAGAIAYLALIVQMMLPTRRAPHSHS